MKKKGFTLIELLTVLAVVSVTLGVFYTVFAANWFAFEDRLIRSHMWHEANEIIESLTDDGRFAQQVDVNTQNNGSQTAQFFDSLDNVIATYQITTDGELLVDRQNRIKSLTNNLDFTRTSFTKDGRALLVNLSFEDDVFIRKVTFNTATEIFPRN